MSLATFTAIGQDMKARVLLAELPERVQDVVGAMLVSGGNLTLAYDDTAGTVTLTASGTDAEIVRDAIGAAVVGTQGVTVAINDAADTITLGITGLTASQVGGLAAVATSGAKADVGLGNVDNTNDANKPVSTAQAQALLPIAFTGTIKGAWAGGTAYAVGDVVIAEAGLFRAVAAHTANAAGFRYDRNSWETVPVPVVAGATSVPVRQLETANLGAGLTTTPRAGVFQRTPPQFNYLAERVIWAFKAPTDVTTSGSGITTAAGTATPGGSIITTRNSGTSTMVVTATLAGTVDLSGNVHVRIPAKISQAVSANMYLTFFLSSTDTSGNNALKVDVVAADPPAYGWRTYSIPLAEMTTVGTGASLSAIKYFRMEVTGVATDSVELSRITYHPNVSTKGKVMLWLDDGALANQPQAIDIAARYNIPVTLAAIAATYTAAGAAITADKARYIQDVLGGQVAVHAFGAADHDRPQDGAVLLEQMLDYQHFGQAMGFKGVADLAYYNTGYPGPFTAEQEGVARKLFRSARATGARYPETLPPGDPYRTRSFMPAASATHAAYYQPLIARAVACRGLVQFVWHAMNSTDLVQFDLLCAYLDANRATVETTTPMRAYDPLCV